MAKRNLVVEPVGEGCDPSKETSLQGLASQTELSKNWKMGRLEVVMEIDFKCLKLWEKKEV